MEPCSVVRRSPPNEPRLARFHGRNSRDCTCRSHRYRPE
jgi:hypothetical protein